MRPTETAVKLERFVPAPFRAAKQEKPALLRGRGGELPVLQYRPHSANQFLDLPERRRRLLVVLILTEEQHLSFGQDRCEGIRKIVPQLAHPGVQLVVHSLTER
jgi:hypothetical protein